MTVLRRFEQTPIPKRHMIFECSLKGAATQLENIPCWDKNILRGEGKRAFGGQKYIKHIKITI